ncbi:hypothetical protein EJB05_12147, partial [Eragrostis curvula]
MAEGGRRRSGEDHISSLPDDLLHDILARLDSVRAAARTGVLSRRWRHVWTQHPDQLFLGNDDKLPYASFLDSIDAVLAAHTAPTVDLLSIYLPHSDGDAPHVSACRVAPWLLFASQRVMGELHVFLPLQMRLLPTPEAEEEEEELEIPACAGATRIELRLDERWRLRIPTAGLFAALTSLTISAARVEGSELSALVTMRCPRLKDLSLRVTLCTVSDISIRTDSLESLWCRINNTSRLEVIAPRLKQLTIHDIESHMISAPKLEELDWACRAIHDPHHHVFADVGLGRHLRLLRINSKSVTASLLQRFDSVDELKLNISIPQDIFGYQSFLNATNKLPKCENLSARVLVNHHRLVSVMLHLLRSCSTIRKLSVALYNSHGLNSMHPCPLSCPCRLAMNCKTEDISLRSLEELEISYFTCSQEELEFMEQLSRCNKAVLKKIVIIYYTYRPHTPLTKEACEKVRSKFCSNIKVEFYVSPDMVRRVPFH